MHIPDFLEPYRLAGQTLLASGAVKGLVFSGPTYQIEILDPVLSDPLWVFLQFDDKEEIKDLFCSCEESSEKGACSHMAAACYYVYHKNNKPQHVRFEISLWHHLFLKMQEDVAPRKPRIEQKEDSIEVFTEDNSLLFRVKGKGDVFDAFSQLLQPKPEETEETSIKFSSLSEEELDRWREGRPSLRLRYELSFFSDVAKWFFAKQEEDKNIPVIFSPLKAIPKQVEITYKELKLEASVDMLSLVGSLNTVDANIRLLEESEYSLERIEFDANNGAFIFYSGQADPSRQKSAIAYGPWFYLPEAGFLSLTAKPKSQTVKKEKDEIIKLFTESLHILKEYLDAPIDEEVKEVRYSIYFDSKARLHVEAYLNEIHDLEQTHVWGDWAYLDGAFVKLAPRKFEELHFIVPKDELSSFLMAHRLWLSQFDGFHVHVAKLEEQILYEIDQLGNLTFRSVLHRLPGTKKCLDLGDWLYTAGDGFYVKNFTDDNPPLPFGRQIPRHLVAEYIRHHLELLQGVPDFFTADNPISGVGLKIELRKKGTIEIQPEYEWHVPEDVNSSFFYDEFVFIRDKGFYRLPQPFRPAHLTREITSTDPQAWSSFFQELLPKLKEEYNCKVDSRLEMAEQLALTVSPQEKAGVTPMRLSDWGLDVSWESQKGSIAMKELIAAKKKQERFLPTDAGVIDLTEDRFRWLDTVKERTKTKGEGDITLNPADFLRVTAYDTIHVDTKGLKSRESFKQLLERLLVQKPTQDIELSSLKCELRSYQKIGVDWLWFLYQNDLSGLLCDDMGVGKTHQAMGLMDGVRNYKRKEGKKSLFLVVCPTSLVYHWQDKLERFLPDFKIKVFVGVARSLDDFEGDYDILLTSYGIWRNESKKFAKHYFDAAFFDELQIAKNHVSQIHTALLQVHAILKIGLTGTPIENHLRELKALFDLVLPGYMPHDADFREFFMRPIERGDNPKRKELLSRFVRPFVLRRRKCDVLPDLPVKTEDLAYAHLADEQKTLYKTVASQQAQPLIRQLRDEGSPIPYMHIFAVLSALKQVCNHPAAYLKDVANYEAYQSGKWEAFVELVEEAIESEQKVVVFSQFLAMLDIIELFLKKRGVGYAQIRGQTKNRGDEISRFHNDPDCKIFLGSLQAAGLGIDLTPASVVIHYDRWWNAARENQATDRVHRIGQVRGVQVFKLLTKATIEERIDQLISQKATLLEDVVFFDDHQIVKRLSRHEIISLLEGLPEE